MGFYMISFQLMDLLGILAFSFVLISIHQTCIYKLRLWGALAGVCFLIQFVMIGDMYINVLGQLGLLIYGVFKAVQEIKEKKSIAIDDKIN